ncbi:MAG: Ig-like domain-containing protein [Nanoarchaeota archaeon]
MIKKVILLIFLSFIILLVGCNLNWSEITITNEVKIKDQMKKWINTWETKDTDVFSDTMVNEGINFLVSNELEKKDMTKSEFISFVSVQEFSTIWNNTTHSAIKNININDNGKTAVLYSEWYIGVEVSGYIFPMEVLFIKADDVWLISDIILGTPKLYYEGEENEIFDPDRHNSYISFKIDGELYVFHDQYGGVDHEMSSIVTYNNNFSIDVFDYNTRERFILDFIWEGEEAGQLDRKRSPVTWRATAEWDDVFEYAADDFVADMEIYDLENGLVQGTFSGHINKLEYGEGESIHITEGFFYIKHEFNIPEVTINNPTDGETVSGDVTISGLATDESELIDVNVSVEENFGENPKEIFDREDADGTNNWGFTFDSTQYINGEYNVEVYAKDKHYNYSLVKSVNIYISN